MKGFSILILLGLLFVSDYAFAQLCPCDALELSDGTSGNEIVQILCPGGELAEGNIFVINPEVVGINGGLVYEVQTSLATCRIVLFDGSVLVSENGAQLTDPQVERCRARLIEGCSLNTNPIPTLSQWGMIATAGVLGVIGLYAAMRRRKAAA